MPELKTAGRFFGSYPENAEVEENEGSKRQKLQERYVIQFGKRIISCLILVGRVRRYQVPQEFSH